MSPDDTDALDDELLAQLAAFDDELARGDTPHRDGPALAANEPEWRRLQACLRLLRQRLDPVAAMPACFGALPERFGRFLIHRELGRGGNGFVFLASDPDLKRQVALKVPRPEALASPGPRERFLREARAAAALDHPNVVQVYEAGEVQTVCYLASAYCPGTDLARWLKENPPPPPRAAAVLILRLAGAVHHAHERGILHRDIKPSNILLQIAERGSHSADCQTDKSAIYDLEAAIPKITDFGLAKLLECDNALTATGTVLGTPQYMAPEQTADGDQQVGPAADTYALGAVLYEMLTGQPPCRGPTPLETLERVRSQEPVSPRQLRRQTPRDLCTICLKCLHKEPARRYASAGELAADLSRYLAGEPIRARPVGPAERCWRWARRNPAWASALVLLVLTALVAVVAAVHLAAALADSEQAHAETKDAERETLHKLYRATVNEARATRLTGRPGQRVRSLALLAEARKLALQLGLPREDFHELRDEFIASLALSDLELLREWDGGNCVFHPDMTHYARLDEQGGVTVHRVADARRVASLPGTSKASDLRYSPDGRYLAVTDRYLPVTGSRFQLWQVGAAAPIMEVPIARVSEGIAASAASCFSFRFDGNQVALLQNEGRTVAVYETATGREVHRGRPGLAVRQMAFHPGGQVLALAVGSEVCLYDPERGRITTRFTPDAALKKPVEINWLDWGFGGKLLAVAGTDGVIRLGQVEAAGQFRLVHKLVGRGRVVAGINADGTVLGSSDVDGTMRLWDLRDGQQLLTPVAEPSWYFLGKSAELLGCCSASGKVRLYRIHLGRECRRLSLHIVAGQLGGRTHAQFDPSGRLLVAAGWDGLAAWDAHRAEGLPLPSRRGNWSVPLGFDSRGALYTQAAAGYQRWPARAEPARPDVIRLGPPQMLRSPGSLVGPAISTDGRILAIPAGDRCARVVFPDEPSKEKWFGPQLGVRYCAVSPDGRWLATGTDGNDVTAVFVWDITRGGPGQAIPATPFMCDVEFSPDGRWLLTAGGGCRLWEVGSWRPGPIVGGLAFAFSPDGLTLAVDSGEGAVRLLNPASGKVYARLRAAEMRLLPCSFSPDGTLLVVKGGESRSMYVWDLRAVRAYLRPLGLDWDLPAYPPATATGPVQLELLER